MTNDTVDPALRGLVERFSAALLDKLVLSGSKRQDGSAWASDHWRVDLTRALAQHIVKGDPLDVAAYTAFAWHHGWSLSPVIAAVFSLPRAFACVLCGGPAEEDLQEACDADVLADRAIAAAILACPRCRVRMVDVGQRHDRVASLTHEVATSLMHEVLAKTRAIASLQARLDEALEERDEARGSAERLASSLYEVETLPMAEAEAVAFDRLRETIFP